LHKSQNFYGSSLNEPVFDIHHGARYQGQSIASASAYEIPYALVVNIKAPKEPNIYNEVLMKYRTRLQALTPVIDIPIQNIPLA